MIKDRRMSKKEELINTALKSAIPMVNESVLSKYACCVCSLSLSEGELHASVAMDGLDGKEFEVVCSDISIGDEYDSVRIGHFSSNMPFLENILNDFATKEFLVAHEFGQVGLLFLKSVL